MDRPRKPVILPSSYDPVRRFVAAYTVQAVMDYFYPPKKLPLKHRQSAIEFVHSLDGQQLIAQFDIPLDKIQQRLQEAVQ
jgi:hypothetical protein